MASVLAKLKPLIVQPCGKHTATVILLHGSEHPNVQDGFSTSLFPLIATNQEDSSNYYTEYSVQTGDVGEGIKGWIEMEMQSRFSFSQTRMIYPTAPLRPYMAANGQMMNVWFQRQQISPFVQEDVDTIQESSDDIRQLVEMEIQTGINPERIIVGGFSMGGSMALYYGMRCGLNLAGVFALSSFLAEKSIVYDDMESDPGPRPPLFQAHGRLDPLVQYDWGMKTHEQLKHYGVSGFLHSYPKLFHELNKQELHLLKTWIEERLPDL